MSGSRLFARSETSSTVKPSVSETQLQSTWMPSLCVSLPWTVSVRPSLITLSWLLSTGMNGLALARSLMHVSTNDS